MYKRNTRLLGKFRLPESLSKHLSIKVIILAVVCLFAVTAGAGYALYKSARRDMPEVASLKNYKPPRGTEVFSEDDHLIGRIKVDKGIFVPLAQIPDNLKNAVVSVEDARFYGHKGLDYRGMLRAMLMDVFTVSFRQGGSTITQQLAKVLFLTPEKSISRKIKEALLARKIEKELNKDEILELYLNKVYFGHGAYGVEMAARTYFGKHVGDLTLAESAMTAGLVRSPGNYSPYNNLEQAKARQGVVLGRMLEEKFITRGQMDKARSQTIVLRNMLAHEEIAPHLIEQIRVYLENTYGPEKVYMEGLTVKTTIDSRLQQAAARALDYGARAVDKRQGWRGPLGKRDKGDLVDVKHIPPARENAFNPGEFGTATVISVDENRAILTARGGRGAIALPDMLWAAGKNGANKKAGDILKPGYVIEVRAKGYDKKLKQTTFSLEQEPAVQGALVAMDPYEGKVRALVGGVDFQKNEFNHAENAHRQPGSAFKPFVYAAAMESGYTPASIIDDSPKSYDNERWNPENYDHEYYGPTRLREALVHSRNVVTIELLHQLGVEKVIDLARKLGMPGPFENNLTLALGSCSVTPVELTSAYCSFANGGYSVTPVIITEVTDRKGTVLESHESEHEEAFSPESAYQVTSMLEDVTSRGTAQSASRLGCPVAGKTGTTNDYKDAWFVGYTPNLVAGVWIGFDDQKSLGRGESGASAALPVWMRFMGEALADRPGEAFAIPSGIEMATIDADTGLLPTGQSKDVIAECFKKGTVPQEYSSGPAPASSAIPTAATAPAGLLGVPEKLMPGISERKRLEDAD